MHVILKEDDIFTRGGSVQEIQNEAYLVSMCDPFSNLYIVDRAKKLQWEAIAEKYSNEANQWKKFPQYRASFIADSTKLAGLIFRTK